MGNPGATHRPHRRPAPRGNTSQPLTRPLPVPQAPARGSGGRRTRPPASTHPARQCRVPLARGSIGGSASCPASARKEPSGRHPPPSSSAAPREHTLQPLPRRQRVPPAPARGSWGTADKSPSLYPPGTAMPGAVSAGVDRGQRPLSGFRPEGIFRAPPTATHTRPAHRQQRQRRLRGRRDDLAHFPLSLPPIPWYTSLVSPLGVPALLAERSIARCLNPSNLIRLVPA